MSGVFPDMTVNRISSATEGYTDEQLSNIVSIAIPLIRQMSSEEIKAPVKDVLTDTGQSI